jgi:hypothetical protein
LAGFYMGFPREVTDPKYALPELPFEPGSIVTEDMVGFPNNRQVERLLYKQGKLRLDPTPPVPEPEPVQPPKRIRGPSLDSVADIRRQAKRLYLRTVPPGDDLLDPETLRMAISLLALIKSTLPEPRETAGKPQQEASPGKLQGPPESAKPPQAAKAPRSPKVPQPAPRLARATQSVRSPQPVQQAKEAVQSAPVAHPAPPQRAQASQPALQAKRPAPHAQPSQSPPLPQGAQGAQQPKEPEPPPFTPRPIPARFIVPKQ